jgi:hypothetical protein
MSQRERALIELKKIAQAVDGLDPIALLLVLGEAQNAPPQGQSDGSITEMEWLATRVLVDAAMRLKDAVMDARKTWRRP